MTKSKKNKKLLLVKIFIGFMFGLMLLPSGIKSITILALGITILILSLSRNFSFNRKMFFINSSLYLLMLVTLIYSDNMEYALIKLQTMSSLLVFPLMFSLLKNGEIKEIYKNLSIYLWIYVIGTFLYNTVPFLWFFLTHYSFAEITQHYPKVVLVDIGRYNIHPIYISMHCCVAILSSFFLFKDLRTKFWKVLLIFINIVLVYFLILYVRKGPVAALIITLFISSFFGEKKFAKYNIPIILVVILLLISIPKTRNRFLELVNIEKVTENNSNSTNIRYSIYQNARKLILESPIMGYGIGDYNDELIKSYKKYDLSLVKEGYNSHNQYISFMLMGGIAMFLVFILIITYNVSHLLVKRNKFLILITIFYCLVMFSENILERENGVIFFSFFFNFFSLKGFYKLDE